jgi:hypothetical protein
MAGELRFATQDDPPRLRTLTPFAGPRSDKFPFELGKTTQYGQHETAVRCRRVSPGVSERFEAGSLFGNCTQEIEEIAGRPRQAIKPGDNQYIALRENRHEPS